jgi:hypothetical protein
MHFHPTLNATLGKSYGFANKPRAYGDVTGVIQEESPINKRLISEVKALRRDKKQFHPNKDQAYQMGSVYDGSMATLEALYSSHYINKPVYVPPSKKAHPNSHEFMTALKEKDPSKRIYAPSILF